MLAENLCVARFNPPVMHRHSALSCFVGKAMPSVPPAVAGNSGPRGVLRGSRMICWPKPMCGQIQSAGDAQA